MRVDFCLPVYNEEKILKANALKLWHYLKKNDFPFEWQIIIIDNGSTDNTLAIGQELASRRQNVSLFHLDLPGKGRALKTYFQTSRADIIAYMDIDLAVSLRHIPELIFPISEGQTDFVMGSRLLPGAKTERGFGRGLSSRGYNLLSRLMLNHKFSDLQCGFKAFHRDLWEKISKNIQDEKFFFDTELVCFADFFNFRLKEIPVDWSENRYQTRKSKIKVSRDGLRFLRNLFKLRQRLLKK